MNTEGLAPVLVTTDSDRRGVFFGYTDQPLEEVIKSGVVKLQGFRNCIYWSRDTGGVFGLAEKGPTESCRIGMKVEQAGFFNGVTFICEVSESAVCAWEAAPCVN